MDALAMKANAIDGVITRTLASEGRLAQRAPQLKGPENSKETLVSVFPFLSLFSLSASFTFFAEKKKPSEVDVVSL